MGACAGAKKQPQKVPQLKQHPTQPQKKELVKIVEYVGQPLQQPKDNPQQNQLPPNSPIKQAHLPINSPKHERSEPPYIYKQPLPKDIVRDQTEADFSLTVKNFDLHVAVIE